MGRIIALYGKRIQADAAQVFKHLMGLLVRRGFSVVCEEQAANSLEDYGIAKESFDGIYSEKSLAELKPEVVLSIGGDGTFLGAASLVKDLEIPILGINCGRMGFLANVAKSEVDKAIEHIANGNYSISHRDVLGYKVEDGTVEGFALNEVSILKSDMASLLMLHVYIDGSYLTTYWADGLVISTPTGSTAYSMSAGGPIVCPDCRLLLLTPVSPHNLNLRPMAIPAASQLEVQVESRSGDYVLCGDSEMYKLSDENKVKISTATYGIKVVKLPGASFYETIRKKLYWGEDMRNSKY